MTTNLLIATCQYTTDATAVTGSSSAETANPITNVITGERGRYTQLAAAATSSWVKFDLGATTDLDIDYYIVARANLLQAQGSKRLLLSGSTDDSSYTNICGNASTFQSLDLYGVRGEDAIFTEDLANSDSGTLPASVSYRYIKHWAAGEGTEPSAKWKHSKVYFGNWFDPGRDPVRPFTVERVENNATRQNAYRLTYTWHGITDEKRAEFFTNLFAEPLKPVFLYTKTYHDVLLNFRLFHCFVYDYSTSYIGINTHEITVTFEEMI